MLVLAVHSPIEAIVPHPNLSIIFSLSLYFESSLLMLIRQAIMLALRAMWLISYLVVE